MSTRDQPHVFSSFCLIAIFSMCFLQVNTSQVSQSNGDLSRYNSNRTNCSQDASTCPQNLHQSCNQTSGLCICPSSEPILLSNEIPCLKAKHLGQVCLHSLECSYVANSACFATILFPLELQSMPTHRQWYIYSQITESGELNYLLNKVYGQCRCKSGYRARHQRKCVSKDTSTGHTCHNSTQCFLSDSHCDLRLGQCVCNEGFTYDSEVNSCSQLTDMHGQFCVISTDCQSQDSNLQCIKSKCVCAQGPRPANQTTCPPLGKCEPGQVWNASTFACESQSFGMLDSLLVKIVLLLLLKLIICNLVRIACYSKRASAQLERNGMHRGSRFFETNRQSDQSRSLLSLPPYEAICHESNGVSPPEERDCLPPTYEEALQSMQSSGGYKALNTSQESEVR